MKGMNTGTVKRSSRDSSLKIFFIVIYIFDLESTIFWNLKKLWRVMDQLLDI